MAPITFLSTFISINTLPFRRDHEKEEREEGEKRDGEREREREMKIKSERKITEREGGGERLIIKK